MRVGQMYDCIYGSKLLLLLLLVTNMMVVVTYFMDNRMVKNLLMIMDKEEMTI